MNIGILIPCFYRPQNMIELILSYEETTKNIESEIYFMTANDDTDTIKIIEQFGYHPMIDNPAQDIRFVKRIQFMYLMSKEKWILTGADDIIFRDGWHESAEIYADRYSVISFEDLCNPNVPGTNFLIKRSYIEDDSGVIDSPNTIFHQGYQHNYCDNELVGTARSRDQFVKCNGIIEHMHPTVGKSEWDKGYNWAQNHWDEDATTFGQRAHLWG